MESVLNKCYLMTRYVLLFIILVLPSINYSQPPKRFITHFGGDGTEIGRAVRVCYDKNYIIAGSTTSYGNGAADAYLVKLDTMGAVLWGKHFGGGGMETATSIILCPLDSGYIFAGYSSSTVNGDYDYFIVRTTKNGSVLWTKTFGGPDWEFGNDIILSGDTNILVCGQTFSTRFGKADGEVFKLDIIDGSLIWDKKFGGNEDDEFLKIQLTSDDYITIVGNTKSYGDKFNDIWMIKLTEGGDSVYSKVIGKSNKTEYIYDFIEDNENRLVFCGSYDTSVVNSGRNAAYLLRTELDGTFVNDSVHPGAFHDDDKFVAISKTYFGNLYLVSRKVNHHDEGFGIDVQPMVWDYDLNPWFTNTYGGIGIDEGHDLVFTDDHGVAIVGHTQSFGLFASDVFFVKLSIYLDSGNVLITGLPQGDNFNFSKFYFYEDRIHLPSEFKGMNYSLIGSDGTLLAYGVIDESTIKMSSELPRGIYCFHVTNNGKSETLKFLFHSNTR